MTAAVNCARRNLRSTCCISSTAAFFDCKSILRKTLKQFGQVTSKYERKSRYKSSFHCVSLRKRVCFCSLLSCYVARYVSSKCASVWLFTVETLSLSPEFVLHRGKPKSISLALKLPANISVSVLYYGLTRTQEPINDELYCCVCFVLFCFFSLT